MNPRLGHERPWADDGKIGVQRAEGGHGEWPEKVTVPLAQLSAEHDDRDAGQALVDEVGDGDVRGYDRDAAADVEHADELERGGSGVDEHRVAVVHQPYCGAGDGLLRLDVDVDPLVLHGNGQPLVKRDGAAVGSAQLARAGQGVEIRARGDR